MIWGVKRLWEINQLLHSEGNALVIDEAEQLTRILKVEVGHTLSERAKIKGCWRVL